MSNDKLSPKWFRSYKKLVYFLDKHDKDRKFAFKGETHEKFLELREKFRNEFVKSEIGKEINIARRWVLRFKEELTVTKEVLNIKGISLSKELRDFVEDPFSHLKKKIFNYMYDLLRGKIDIDSFKRSASAAVKTSFRTNLRNLYQCWVLISILKLLGSLGAKIIYPEHGYLSLERLGKQKTGGIPPNCIMYIPSAGFLSFFLEAPRPISWEDSEDLRKIWSLYTALRPDILVYGGKVVDIVSLESNPPIKRPDIIIECKELTDWYLRVREIRGPLTKPLTAEEWRSKWINGLWEGLADILGVKRSEAITTVEERKAIRLKDLQIVTLYHSLYQPKYMVVISRTRVPEEVRDYLINHGIDLIDSVGFNSKRLKPLVDNISSFAGMEAQFELLELKSDMLDKLRSLQEILRKKNINLPIEKIIKYSLLFALDNLNDYMSFISNREEFS